MCKEDHSSPNYASDGSLSYPKGGFARTPKSGFKNERSTRHKAVIGLMNFYKSHFSTLGAPVSYKTGETRVSPQRTGYMGKAQKVS